MFGAISENFVLSVCRLILRFPQFFTLVGGWGDSFSLFQSYEIFITLSINSLEKPKPIWTFYDSPYLIMKQTDKMAQFLIRFNC